jgi:hypothetical protein
MTVALFHAVPLTIELIWTAAAKYVAVVIETYRYRRSIKTAPDQTDVELGVESAMPNGFRSDPKTQNGENSSQTKPKRGDDG